MDDLTIFSVYHSEKTKKFIEWNYENIKTLNPSASFKWLVTDNSPVGAIEKIDDKKFTLFPRVILPKNSPQWMLPSLWHALALNQMVPHLKTRFALFLDADFLMLYPKWISEVLEYMKSNKLAVFGVPYHPRDYKKPRYFPSVPCMFVDGAQISVSKIDFRPQYPGILASLDGGSYRAPRLHKLFLRLNELFWGERRKIDSSRDTGSQIYIKYAKSLRSEYVTPVFNPSRDFIGPDWAKSGWNIFLEKILPERLCFFPKKKGYFSEKGFKELGYYDVAGLGLEEYVWQDKPFGFHFRGTFAKKWTPEEEIAIAGEALRSLVK